MESSVPAFSNLKRKFFTPANELIENRRGAFKCMQKVSVINVIAKELKSELSFYRETQLATITLNPSAK